MISFQIAEVAQRGGEFIKGAVHIDSLPTIILDSGFDISTVMAALIAGAVPAFVAWLSLKHSNKNFKDSLEAQNSNLKESIISQERSNLKAITADYNLKRNLAWEEEFKCLISGLIVNLSNFVGYNSDHKAACYIAALNFANNKDLKFNTEQINLSFDNKKSANHEILMSITKLKLMHNQIRFHALVRLLNRIIDFIDEIQIESITASIDRKKGLVRITKDNKHKTISIKEHVEILDSSIRKIPSEQNELIRKLKAFEKDLLKYSKSIIRNNYRLNK